MLSELQQTADAHRALTGAVPDLILRVREDGTVTDANRPNDPLLGPAAGGQLRRRLPEELAERSLAEVQAALRGGGMRIFDCRLESGGSARDYEVRVVVIGSGEVLEIIRDVTERKQAEELAEKELLLREIHHRVKNNLQVISSLLYLQGQQAGDPRLTAILEENRQRIRSMALIHEKLYQSNQPGKVRFAAYLRDLANNLLVAYGAGAPGVRLELAVPEEEELGLETAVLLGLLISELISNSLKHAFPQEASGVVRIALQPSGDGAFDLEVGDDGMGLPAGCDPDTAQSMGLKLVRLFAAQLEASMEVERTGGTRYRFFFKPGR
jgi:two-component sensor histidine kinase